MEGMADCQGKKCQPQVLPLKTQTGYIDEGFSKQTESKMLDFLPVLNISISVPVTSIVIFISFLQMENPTRGQLQFEKEINSQDFFWSSILTLCEQWIPWVLCPHECCLASSHLKAKGHDVVMPFSSLPRPQRREESHTFVPSVSIHLCPWQYLQNFLPDSSPCVLSTTSKGRAIQGADCLRWQSQLPRLLPGSGAAPDLGQSRGWALRSLIITQNIGWNPQLE